jgi:hypothetical protein
VAGFESSELMDSELRRRVADDPLAALSAITDLRATIAQREKEAVFLALEDHTWREVGAALGVSKQAAFQRFGRPWAVMTKAKLPKAAWKETVRQRLSG